MIPEGVLKLPEFSPESGVNKPLKEITSSLTDVDRIEVPFQFGEKKGALILAAVSSARLSQNLSDYNPYCVPFGSVQMTTEINSGGIFYTNTPFEIYLSFETSGQKDDNLDKQGFPNDYVVQIKHKDVVVYQNPADYWYEDEELMRVNTEPVVYSDLYCEERLGVALLPRDPQMLAGLEIEFIVPSGE